MLKKLHYPKINEPLRGWTHLAGALLSIAGLVLLVTFASIHGTAWHVASFAIFGASLVLLYSASTLYHLLPISSRAKKIFRRIDHALIFVLIAGTYTPITLVPLRGAWGWSLFGVVWGVAILGIVIKAAWIRIPRWLSTMIYLLLGWLIVIAFLPLLHSLPPEGIAWLVAGGIFYSLGALFFSFEKIPAINRFLDWHVVFHFFVLAGSFSHFWLMWRYILPL